MKSANGSQTVSRPEETQKKKKKKKSTPFGADRSRNRIAGYFHAAVAGRRIPGLRLKALRSLLLMQVAVSVTADMWERSCMAHSGC